MNMTTRQLLKIATSGLTGKREQDIAYLNEQIRTFRSDERIVAALEGILSSLTVCEMVQSASF